MKTLTHRRLHCRRGQAPGIRPRRSHWCRRVSAPPRHHHRHHLQTAATTAGAVSPAPSPRPRCRLRPCPCCRPAPYPAQKSPSLKKAGAQASSLAFPQEPHLDLPRACRPRRSDQRHLLHLAAPEGDNWGDLGPLMLDGLPARAPRSWGCLCWCVHSRSWDCPVRPPEGRYTTGPATPSARHMLAWLMQCTPAPRDSRSS